MKNTFFISTISISLLLLFTSMKPPAKPCVYLFLQADCPCVYSHKDSFGQLLRKYSNKVDFVVVFEGKNDSRQQIEKLLKNLDWKISYKKDNNQKLVKQLKPKVSTDCVVTDQAGKVIYKGAIDDGVKNMGMIKAFYLKEVIEALLQHKSAPYSNMPGIGCTLS